MMKRSGLFLLITLTVSAALPFAYPHNSASSEKSLEEGFFFGTSYGLENVEDAKLLIDKVKDYTNLFVIGSWSIVINETALNEVCEYAVKADLSFIVYFDYISQVMYPWHQTWLDTAKEKYGDKFLGIYLYDEPGGRQIDEKQWDGGDILLNAFANVSNYNDAANIFVGTMSTSRSTLDLKDRKISMFTSDYALYWFGYLGGYDAVFVELGWNHTTTQQIALNRGAANLQGKDWGAIIVWTYDNPPYLASREEIYREMVTAYRAGAKYVIVFNYPQNPEGNTYGILTEEHFEAMKILCIR